MLKQFTLRTPSRACLEDITARVADVVRESAVTEGVCFVFAPHTTAGVTINENADPDVVRDILFKTSEVFPQDPRFRHGEGNSDSHIKASLVGNSETILIDGGRLVLGTWQGIYFAEFDGPRTRTVHVKVMAG